jgi:hypothetical protein
MDNHSLDSDVVKRLSAICRAILASAVFVGYFGVELKTAYAESPSAFSVDRVMPGLTTRIAASAAVLQAPPSHIAQLAQLGLQQFILQNQQLSFDDLAATSPVASPQDFSQMQRYFANLYQNLTPSKTIKIGAQTFECIPIKQQPSLRLSGGIDTPPGTNAPRPGRSILGYQNMDCGKDEIPLKQASLAQIASHQTLRDYFSKDQGLSRRLTDQLYHFQTPSSTPVPQMPHPQNGDSILSDGFVHRYAVMYGDYPQAIGLSANLNLWSPMTSGSDMSLAQSWIVGGSGNATQTLESGWQVWSGVDPVKSAPFVYSTQDNYSNTGCYDLDCVGFVQVTNQIVFAVLAENEYSVFNGRQRTLGVTWVRKATNGNWWLNLNGIWIGYYPSSLFAGGSLASPNSALRVEFGGENTGATPRVQMGSGRHASSGYQHAAFASNLSITSVGGLSQPFQGSIYVTDPLCYSLQDGGSSGPDGTIGRFFYFGGPGTADAGCARIVSSSVSHP